MKIWIDGDACPNVIKEIIFRAAVRTKTHTILVANQLIKLRPSPYIKQKLVTGGFDVADNEIVESCEPGDLIITADIPLADAVITKGAFALNPRGELYNANNIKSRLAVRDLCETLRSTQQIQSGPSKFTKSNLQAFANQLDKFLNKPTINRSL